MDRAEMFDKTQEIQKNHTDMFMEYWREYSHMGTWQFWVCLGMLVIPLIVLYFKLNRDRRTIFVIGFFGFAIHSATGYIDIYGQRNDLWSYPYNAIPFLPVGFFIDASLVPVVFMLIYQWVWKTDRSFYIWAFIACVIFTFGFKPILVWLGLFELNISYFGLFLAYLVTVVAGKVITDVFLWLEDKEKRIL
jgi:hypothetical protein